MFHVHVSRNPVSRRSLTLLEKPGNNRSSFMSKSNLSVWQSVNRRDVGVSVEELLRGRGSAREASPMWCDGDEKPALHTLNPEPTSGLISFSLS